MKKIFLLILTLLFSINSELFLGFCPQLCAMEDGQRSHSKKSDKAEQVDLEAQTPVVSSTSISTGQLPINIPNQDLILVIESAVQRLLPSLVGRSAMPDLLTSKIKKVSKRTKKSKQVQNENHQSLTQALKLGDKRAANRNIYNVIATGVAAGLIIFFNWFIDHYQKDSK